MTRNSAPRRRVHRLATVTLLAAVTLLSAGGCSLLRRTQEPASGPALLIFRNDALDQATVYIAATGVDFQRIGTVMAGHTDTLQVPTSFTSRASSLNIVARILAHATMPSTGPVTIQAGERYDVHLYSDEKTLSFLPARD